MASYVCYNGFLYVHTKTLLLLFIFLYTCDCGESGQDVLLVTTQCEGEVTDTRCHIDCPSNCTCILDDVTIISNCTDGSVFGTEVQYPHDDVISLSWAESSLQSVKPLAFVKFANSLQVLNLSNNALHRIEPHVFHGLTKLQKLELNNNSIGSLEVNIFDELVSLESLDLDNNNISFIESGVFEALTSLWKLDLQHNALKDIQPDVFRGLQNLKWLFLQNNELEVIQPGVFQEMKNLERIYLHYNALCDLQPGVFQGLGGLEWLFLHNNALHELHSGVLDGLGNLKWLYLQNNSLKNIHHGVFKGLSNLTWLFLHNNALHRIQFGAFADLTTLQWLSLDNNTLAEIPHNSFGSLVNLQTLYLSYNEIYFLHPDTFQNQSKLQELTLDYNQLHYLHPNIFQNLTRLRYLNLSANFLNQIPILSKCTSLTTLVLKGNPLLWIHRDVFGGLNKTVNLLVTKFATCCYATSIQCNSDEPPSPFLTCTSLLTFDLLRITMWLIGVIGMLGNIFSLYSGFKHKQPANNKVQFLLITNLSISDLVMCIYLIILLSVDMYYAEYFPANSESWQNSVLCRFAGALSVLSSEASTFFITLISIDRFLRVKYRYPFGKWHLRPTLAKYILVTLWSLAASLSIATFVLAGADSSYYAISEVCVGLPISKFKFYNSSTVAVSNDHSQNNISRVLLEDNTSMSIHNYSQVSMYLSIVIFTGLNLACFSIVGFCYTAIFIDASKTSRASGRSQRSREEIQMAVRMSLLVLTDFVCWVPVGILSILVQIGVVEVSPTAYVWIAAFVLPINSALNPFLYTSRRFSFGNFKCFHCEQRSQEEDVPMMKIESKNNMTKDDCTSAWPNN